MSYYITQVLFWGIPLAAVVLFAVSLIRYIDGRRQNKRQPDTVPPQQMRTRQLLLIISATVVGTMLAVVLGFIALLYTAVAFM